MAAVHAVTVAPPLVDFVATGDIYDSHTSLVYFNRSTVAAAGSRLNGTNWKMTTRPLLCPRMTELSWDPTQPRNPRPQQNIRTSS